MKVAIIGAGWYGCHMAVVLLNMGIDVEIYERNETLFLGSSGNNQFRLHEGLHYPRSYKTRVQIVEGFKKFLEVYPFLTIPIDNNMYAIAEKESLLDFGTFRQVMEGSKIHHKEVPLTHMKDTKLRRVEGILLARERALLVNTPAVYFEEKLRSVFRFNTKITSVTQISSKDSGSRKTLTQFCHTSNNYYKTANIEEEEEEEELLESIDEDAETEPDYDDSPYDRILVNNKEYDWCINCTYQQLFPLPHIKTFFEPCLAFIYKDIRSEEDMPDTMAFTVMDGEFCSLYPYITDEETFKNKPHERLYTLTHVSHTPLGNFSDFEEAEKCRLSLHQNKNLLEKKRKLFEAGIIKFYRNFLEHFQFYSFFTGMKTKFSGASAASRECIVARDDRLIHVISGKVNTLFNAEERILKVMGLRNTPRVPPRVQ